MTQQPKCGMGGRGKFTDKGHGGDDEGNEVGDRVILPLWVRFVETTHGRKERKEVRKGVLKGPKQCLRRNRLLEGHLCRPFQEEGRVPLKVCR